MPLSLEHDSMTYNHIESGTSKQYRSYFSSLLGVISNSGLYCLRTKQGLLLASTWMNRDSVEKGHELSRGIGGF